MMASGVLSRFGGAASGALTVIGLVLAAGWIAVDVFAGIGGPTGDIIHALDGAAAGVYGAIIIGQHRSSARGIGGTLAMLSLGIFHLAWVVAICSVIQMLFGMRDQGGWLLYAVTGGVFATTIALTAGAWAPVFIMTAATAASILTDQLLPRNGSLSMGIACAFLHAGIATSLAVSVSSSHRRFVELWRCQACGYDLSGYLHRVCPECGCARADLQDPRMAADPTTKA